MFDADLCAVLSDLAAGVLEGNTNATYPMKALLLITGFMPALDNQVRRGLGIAGFAGTNATQFVMPTDVSSKEAMKLTRLPFFLGECYVNNAAILQGAATASRYPWLATEPGRLFDVLLFMQGDTRRQMLSLDPPNPHWYRVP